MSLRNRAFATKFQDCMFKNTHGLRAMEDNRLKVYEKGVH